MNLKNYFLYLVEKLLKKPNINNGFIEVKPKPEDFIHLGGQVEKKILCQDLDWTPYCPIGEKQNRNGNESLSCVTQSAMNAIEILVNKYIALVNEGKADQEQKGIVQVFKEFNLIKNGETNCSDRYIAKLSGTTRRGNSQDKVADTIRHYGLIPEDDWGWVDGWDNYYKEIEHPLIDRGLEVLEYIEINYEWVSPANMKDALKYAPVQTSVFAWNGMSNGIYYKTANRLNHAVVNVKFEPNTYYTIFDSYEVFKKLCALNFNFGWGMVYSIHLKSIPKFNIEKIKELEAKGFKYIMRAEAKGEIYELTQTGELKYISPNEIIPVGIKSLSDTKKIIGITEDLYNNLINKL